jgi:hypothetical protein
MSDKPIVHLEGWQLLSLNDRPHQLVGFATDHPRLPGYRRHLLTARVRAISSDAREAETLNTLYRLRHPVSAMIFDGRFPVRIVIADLVARSSVAGGDWRICHDDTILGDAIADYKTAILCMLAILDRTSTDHS